MFVPADQAVSDDSLNGNPYADWSLQDYGSSNENKGIDNNIDSGVGSVSETGGFNPAPIQSPKPAMLADNGMWEQQDDGSWVWVSSDGTYYDPDTDQVVNPDAYDDVAPVGVTKQIPLTTGNWYDPILPQLPQLTGDISDFFKNKSGQTNTYYGTGATVTASKLPTVAPKQSSSFSWWWLLIIGGIVYAVWPKGRRY